MFPCIIDLVKCKLINITIITHRDCELGMTELYDTHIEKHSTLYLNGKIDIERKGKILKLVC